MSDSLNDLQSSLKMFTQGLQQYSISSGIQDAQAKVDQINQSADLDIMQKRQQQMQAAQELALHMTRSGADSAHIQGAVGAIAPKAIKNSQDAYVMAQEHSYDPDVMKKFLGVGDQLAKKEQEDGLNKIGASGTEQRKNINLEYDRKERMLKAEAPIEAAKAEAKFSREEVRAGEMQLEKMGKITLVPSSRSPAGRYIKAVDDSDAAMQLLTQYAPAGKDLKNMTKEERIAVFNKLDGPMRAKLNAAVDRLVSGAAPTVSGREHLMNKTAVADLMKAKSYLSNKVVGEEAGAFVEQMYDTIHREKEMFTDRAIELGSEMKSMFPTAFKTHPEEARRLSTRALRYGSASAPEAQAGAAPVSKADSIRAYALELQKRNPDDPRAKALLKRYGSGSGGNAGASGGF